MKEIYINQSEIRCIKNKYNNYCNVLNENAKKIVKINPHFNNKDLILHTLCFNKYRKEIYKIIENIIAEESKFFSQELVSSIFFDTEYKLLYNHCRKEGTTLIGCNYAEYENNIKQITIGEDEIENINRMLDYDPITNTFTINNENLQKEIDKHIFNTENKKQEQILKNIEEFNKVCSELYKHGIAAYNYINPYEDITEIRMSEELAKDILNIK